jgi:hypothetical protein
MELIILFMRASRLSPKKPKKPPNQIPNAGPTIDQPLFPKVVADGSEHFGLEAVRVNLAKQMLVNLREQLLLVLGHFDGRLDAFHANEELGDELDVAAKGWQVVPEALMEGVANLLDESAAALNALE